MISPPSAACSAARPSRPTAAGCAWSTRSSEQRRAARSVPMTFGLGIRVQEGLLAIADTRITSGTEVTQARKIRVYEHDDHAFFILASGLRSVRDKALTYFDAFLEDAERP